MKKDLIEDKLYQIIEKINERKITPVTTPIHSIYDGNGRACKILLSNYIHCGFKSFKNIQNKI